MTYAFCIPALTPAILLTLTLAGTASAQTFRPGVLTPAIPSISNPAQHYAVYLPSTYDRDKPAPIMFILDYRGRARVAAEVFIPAAERFGWILMSSSNAVSDETMTPTLDALRTMWTDADDLFTIDPRRTYLAGLSGTARIATWVASQKPPAFTGVIGAAAGFAELAPPSADMRFAYYGTVGNVDYNYWEMRQLENQLVDLRFPHRVNYFGNGGHGWMPPDVAMAAVAWMELLAMKSRSRAMDDALVDAFWKQDVDEVLALKEEGRPRAAMRALEAMARDYSGLRPDRDIADIVAQGTNLAADPGIALEARTAQVAAKAHTNRVGAMMQTLADAFPPDDGTPGRSVAQTLADLGVPTLLRSAGGKDQVATLASRRLLAELTVQTGFYLPVAALATNDDERAKFYLDIAQVLDPEGSYAWFLRAKVAARLKRTADAIDALTRAVQLGFRTLGPLETDVAFRDLRSRQEFQSLVEQVRASWTVSRR